jgi:hypothetical protein
MFLSRRVPYKDVMRAQIKAQQALHEARSIA